MSSLREVEQVAQAPVRLCPSLASQVELVGGSLAER